MGCLQSQEQKIHAAEVAQQKERMSVTMTRLGKALQVKRLEFQKESEKAIASAGPRAPGVGTTTLESILMRFRKVKHAVELVKSAFLKNAAADNSLNFAGLTKAMGILHGQMTENDIRNVFEFVDLDASHSISMKEFLVAITVGYCLDLVPEVVSQSTKNKSKAAAATPSAASATAGDSPVAPTDASSAATPGADTSADTGKERESSVSVSADVKRSLEIKEMLNLVVKAYLLFDPEGKGHIVKGSLETVMGDAGTSNGKGGPKKKTSGGGFLSEDKWNEMDWDSNGTIDFAEFVFSFASWVDLDEELDDLDADARREHAAAEQARLGAPGARAASVAALVT